MDETRLTCPYCRTRYQAKDAVCPRCGKALSPTGYSRYGESEVQAQSPQPAPLPALLARPASARVGGLDRSRNRDTQIQAWRYYVLSFVVIVIVIIVFAIFGRQSKHDYGPAISISPQYVTPIAQAAKTPASIRRFACTPPPEVTLYPVRPTAVPSDEAHLPKEVGTMAYLTATGTPTQPSVSPQISYILTLTTTKGVLQAKMYNVGATFVDMPSIDKLQGKEIADLWGQLAIFMDAPIASDLVANNLQPQCGSIGLSSITRNNNVYSSQFFIVTTNDTSGPGAVQRSPNQNYVIVGQLTEGYQLLGTFASGDRVINASVDNSP